MNVDWGIKFKIWKVSAKDEDEFMVGMEVFTCKDISCPVVFECFTSPKDESDAYSILHSLDAYDTQLVMLPRIKGLVPNRIKSAAKVLFDSLVDSISNGNREKDGC